jgi:hypothetical protein
MLPTSPALRILYLLISLIPPSAVLRCAAYLDRPSFYLFFLQSFSHTLYFLWSRMSDLPIDGVSSPFLPERVTGVRYSICIHMLPSSASPCPILRIPSSTQYIVVVLVGWGVGVGNFSSRESMPVIRGLK